MCNHESNETGTALPRKCNKCREYIMNDANDLLNTEPIEYVRSETAKVYSTHRQFFLDVRQLLKYLPERFDNFSEVARIKNELDKFTESEQRSLPFK